MVRNLAEARMHIRRQLTEIENKRITDIAESLQKAFNISSGEISSAAIRAYLSDKYPNTEHALLHQIIAGKSLFYFSYD